MHALYPLPHFAPQGIAPEQMLSSTPGSLLREGIDSPDRCAGFLKGLQLPINYHAAQIKQPCSTPARTWW